METRTTFTNSREIYIFATYFVFIYVISIDTYSSNALPIAELIEKIFDWKTEATTMDKLNTNPNPFFVFKKQLFLHSVVKKESISLSEIQLNVRVSLYLAIKLGYALLFWLL